MPPTPTTPTSLNLTPGFPQRCATHSLPPYTSPASLSLSHRNSTNIVPRPRPPKARPNSSTQHQHSTTICNASVCPTAAQTFPNQKPFEVHKGMQRPPPSTRKIESNEQIGFQQRHAHPHPQLSTTHISVNPAHRNFKKNMPRPRPITAQITLST